MTFSIAASTLLVLIFLVWLILTLVRNEASATQFWWNLLVAVAILVTFGPRLL